MQKRDLNLNNFLDCYQAVVSASLRANEHVSIKIFNKDGYLGVYVNSQCYTYKDSFMCNADEYNIISSKLCSIFMGVDNDVSAKIEKGSKNDLFNIFNTRFNLECEIINENILSQCSEFIARNEQLNSIRKKLSISENDFEKKANLFKTYKTYIKRVLKASEKVTIHPYYLDDSFYLDIINGENKCFHGRIACEPSKAQSLINIIYGDFVDNYRLTQSHFHLKTEENLKMSKLHDGNLRLDSDALSILIGFTESDADKYFDLYTKAKSTIDLTEKTLVKR